MLKTFNILRKLQQPIFRVTTKNYVRTKTNPGIQKRLKLPIYEDEQMKEEFDLEDCELDMENTRKTAWEHHRDLQKQKEQLELNIVRQKHFKEKNPNFLTWKEKEQIRQLHRQDPEEWPIERLVESYPALYETVAKLVKNSWTPKSVLKIKNHDENVKKNWQLFRKNKLDLNPILAEHIRKFSQRKNLLIDDTTSSSISEFSDLLKIANNNSTELTITKNSPQNFNSTHSMTLEQFKSCNNIVDEKINYPTSSIEQSNPNLETEIILHKESVNDQNQIKVRDNIKIPRKVWKKGATYRVEDSYYDDDGEFLYRVLGMTK